MSRIYETDLVHNGDLRYRVQVRQLPNGVIQQRHIFYANDEAEGAPMSERPTVDPWLYTRARSLEDYTRNMKPAHGYLDEWGEAIAALEAIARGHNDARERAMQALHRIRTQNQ